LVVLVKLFKGLNNDMKILQKICFVLLLGTFSSAYGGSCWDKVPDVDDCRVRAKSGFFTKGDAKAQLNLALMYYMPGEGFRQDTKKAVRWFRKSAEQGYAIAQRYLGYQYAKGQGGVRQDYKEAVRWYRRAAEQGESGGAFLLGGMYKRGRGVPQDYVMAHMFYNLAAVSGDEDGEYFRDLIAKEMTPSQIAEAQRMAREWVQKHQ
jgi:uncharacterized protein